MFDFLSNKLTEVFGKLRGSAVLKESDVDMALREIRLALLDADVSLEVAKTFISKVKEKAIGQEVIRSVSPAQMVIKIVHDQLVELLGERVEPKIAGRPHKILLVGLQGAGKTTTAAKLAHYWAGMAKKVFLCSADIYRPAAMEQLQILSTKIAGANFYDEGLGQSSVEKIINGAMYKSTEYDVFIIDTAGRLQIDDMKMAELQTINNIVQADEILLVADMMTGQEALSIASAFSSKLPVTGVILTRADGDARGGVALSMREVTGCPIRFIGTGEQLDSLSIFDAERMAGRLLGMGDVVALVEKARQAFSQQETEKAAQLLQSGNFTLDDFVHQMEKMSTMGGLKTIVKMLPQGQKINSMMEQVGVSDKTIAHHIAIVRSMTAKERANHKLLNGSRRKRIALGSGTSVQQVNQLIKQYESMCKFFRQIQSGGFMKSIASLMKGRVK